MRTIYLFLTFSLVSILASCTDDAANSPGIQLDIVPLEIGNTWIYNVKVMDFQGNETDSYIDTVQIVGRLEKDGIYWYQKVFYHDGDTVLLYNKSNGLWFSTTNLAKEPFVLALYPAKKNDVFRKEIAGTNNGDTVWHESRVAEVNVPVTVYGRNYNCFKYEHSLYKSPNETFNEMIYQVSYYSPGTGAIKEMFYFFESEQIKRFPGKLYELKEFKKLNVE